MATINISDIVSDAIDGDGIFDKLMSAVELRIEAQYNDGRILSQDYATVYLGAMQSVLQQSIAYTLGVQQADKQADLLVEQANLVKDQSSKAQAEKDLLNQKKLTEQAQILDTVDGNAVVGIVGKQKALYTNQADGFLREAEVKAAKIFTDLWTIAKSTSPDDLELALPLNVDQSSMDAVLLKLAENGLNMTQAELGTQSSEFSTHTITGVTDPGASDISITTDNPHGMSTGDAVRITSVGGSIELNDNNYIITSTGASTFTLNDTDALVVTAYTSGGVVTEL